MVCVLIAPPVGVYYNSIIVIIIIIIIIIITCVTNPLPDLYYL